VLFRQSLRLELKSSMSKLSLLLLTYQLGEERRMPVKADVQRSVRPATIA